MDNAKQPTSSPILNKEKQNGRAEKQLNQNDIAHMDVVMEDGSEILVDAIAESCPQEDDASDEFFDAEEFPGELLPSNANEEFTTIKLGLAKDRETLQPSIRSVHLKSLYEECDIKESDIALLSEIVSPYRYDEITLVRFLVGADMSIKVAAQKLQQDTLWRQKEKPDQIPASCVTPIFDNGEIVELEVCDNNGYPVVFMRSRMHKMFSLPKKVTYKDIMLFMIEHLLKKCERVTCIVDMKSIRWKNVDIPMILEALNLYNNHYPERLGDLIFMGGEFWFEYGLKLVKNLIGPRTVPRIHYVKTLEEVSKFIDPIYLPDDCILVEDGGHRELSL